MLTATEHGVRIEFEDKAGVISLDLDTYLFLVKESKDLDSLRRLVGQHAKKHRARTVAAAT